MPEMVWSRSNTRCQVSSQGKKALSLLQGIDLSPLSPLSEEICYVPPLVSDWAECEQECSNGHASNPRASIESCQATFPATDRAKSPFLPTRSVWLHLGLLLPPLSSFHRRTGRRWRRKRRDPAGLVYIDKNEAETFGNPKRRK
jgi:hypothetical protein